jgi:hypothetical protein
VAKSDVWVRPGQQLVRADTIQRIGWEAGPVVLALKVTGEREVVPVDVPAAARPDARRGAAPGGRCGARGPAAGRCGGLCELLATFSPTFSPSPHFHWFVPTRWELPRPARGTSDAHQSGGSSKMSVQLR